MDQYEKIQKKFNSYVFLSTFARALIETFIPLLLFKFGYSLKEVVFYFFIYNLIELILTYPLVYIATKKGNKVLAIFGFLAFILLQVYLNNMVYGTIYLVIIAFLYALYRTGYWLSRRYFNLKVIHKKHISSTYSIVTIINQVALVFAGYMGALFLDNISTFALTIVAGILYIVSIIPLFMFKFEHDNTNTDVKLNMRKTFKEIPFSNLYLFGSYEILNVLKFFFTLYLFIYVKETYQTVGLFNVITNLSIIIFDYFYGKKNYLKLSIFLTGAVYLLKANALGVFLVIVSLIEGIAIKMYELSINKELYTLSKKFEYNNYNLMYELLCKIFRGIVLFISYFFIAGRFENDLIIMIYISVAIILLGLLFGIKKVRKKEFKFEETE